MNQKKEQKEKGTATGRETARRRITPLGWVGIALGSLVLLVIGLLAAATLWLTPARLSELVSREGGEYLDADVKVCNMRFSLWSTFPRLWLEADSIELRARTLKGIAPELLDSLPPDAARLLTVGSFRGGVDIPGLLKGKIRLRDVRIGNLDLNLVQVSDSVANYLIFPQTTSRLPHIPEITANIITLADSGRVSYFSLPSGLDALIALRDLRLEKQREHNGTGSRETDYAFTLGGILSLSAGDIDMLHEFPVRLGGDVGIGYRPLRIRLSDYRMALGNLNARVSLSLRGEENPELSSFSCSVDQFHLLRLLSYLPAAFIPHFSGVTTDIRMQAQARLSAPYMLGSSELPSLQVAVGVADGTIDYRLDNGESLSLSHIGLSADLDFNGAHPEESRVVVPEFELECDGAEARISGMVSDLFGLPVVSSRWEINGDAEEMSRHLPWLRDASVSGTVAGDGELDFRIVNLTARALDSLRLDGELRFPQIAMITEPGRSALTGSDIAMRFSLAGNIKSGEPHLTRPTDYSLTIGDLRWRRDSTRLRLRGATLDGAMALLSGKAGFDTLTSRLHATEFRLDEPRNHVGVNNLDTRINLRRSTQAERTALQAAPVTAWSDSSALERTPHTPLALLGDSPAMRTFVTNWRMNTDLSVGSARWDIRDYPHPFLFGHAELSTDFDRLEISRIGFRSGESSATLSGSAGGFRRFFRFDTPSPLEATLRLSAGTIDINGIAKACEEAAGTRATRHAPSRASRSEREKREAATQTPAWLIPRNLTAGISISADTIRYANLRLTDASGRIGVAEGNLKVENLRMATDFASAQLGLTYSSSDLLGLRVAADLGIDNLQLTGFYGAFKELMADMPQLRNLTGYISVGGKIGLDIFPDMTVNMPSLTADLNVGGRGLVLRQDPFIHRIARMMLITNKEPIEIADVDMKARVFDNLLEVEPFEFKFRDYRLMMMGVNNFGAEIMYHIGIEDSPLHIPFGINIEGNFHHPRLRFGGAHWKDERAWRITSDIEKSFRWNFVREVSHYGDAFMKKAASGKPL